MSKAGNFVKHFFSKDAEPGNVPNRELLNFSIGLTGQNVSYNYISSWLTYFYNTILKVDPTKVGRVFFITHLWDAINDPLIGSIIDRRRFKSGEKLRPFLLYLPPFIGVVTAMLFMNAPLQANGMLSENELLFYLLIIYLIWDIIYSIQDVALWGMVAVVSPNSNERGRVSQWVSIGAGAGGAIAGVFSFLRDMLGTNGLGMSDSHIFMLFAVIFGLGGQLLSMRAHKAQERVRSNSHQDSMRETLSLLFKNKKLLIITIARIVSNIFPKVGAIYFFENCMEITIGTHTISGQTLYTIIPLLAGIPSSLAIFFANKIAIRVGGMKKLLFFAKAIEFTCRILSYFVGINQGYNVVWRLVIIVLLNAVMNIPTSMMDIAHRALTSDGIDEVELETGKRSEGVAFATQNFVSKLNDGITKLIEGYMLAWMGYKTSDASGTGAAGLTVQSDSFKKKQWPLYILSPAIGAATYLIAICFIKDDRQKQDEISRQLVERRAALEAEKETASTKE